MRQDASLLESGFMDTQRNPTLIISAILAGLCPLVGNGLYAGPEGDGQVMLDEIQSGVPVIAYVAYPLELVGFIAMAVVLGWLVVHLQRHAPVAGVAGGILGASMLAVKVGSLAPGMAMQTHGAGVDPATVELVSSLGDQDFVVSGFLFCAAFAAAGFGLVRTSMRRWLAWWPAVVGVAGVAAGIVGMVRPETFVPIPYLLLLLWLIVLGIVAATEPSRTIPTESQVGATE